MDLRSEIGHAVYMLGTNRVCRGERPLTNGQRAVWSATLRRLRSDDTVTVLGYCSVYARVIGWPVPYEVEFGLSNAVDCWDFLNHVSAGRHEQYEMRSITPQ